MRLLSCIEPPNSTFTSPVFMLPNLIGRMAKVSETTGDFNL